MTFYAGQVVTASQMNTELGVATFRAGQKLRQSQLDPVLEPGERVRAVDLNQIFGDGGGGPGPGPVGDVPGDVLDLTNWKWQGPTEDPNDEGDLIEVEQPELDTYDDAALFLDDVTQRVIMLAPVQGFETSDATRSEFREMEGATEAAWSPFHPTPRSLTVHERVDPTSLTDRQEIIVGQIHGAGSSPIPLILSIEWDTAADAPRLRVFHDSPSVPPSLLTPGLSTTTDYTYRIAYEPGNDPENGTGRVDVTAAFGDPSNLPAEPEPEHSFPASAFDDQVGWYFKFGSYNKSKKADGGSGTARVEIISMQLIQ